MMPLFSDVQRALTSYDAAILPINKKANVRAMHDKGVEHILRALNLYDVAARVTIPIRSQITSTDGNISDHLWLRLCDRLQKFKVAKTAKPDPAPGGKKKRGPQDQHYQVFPSGTQSEDPAIIEGLSSLWKSNIGDFILPALELVFSKAGSLRDARDARALQNQRLLTNDQPTRIRNEQYNTLAQAHGAVTDGRIGKRSQEPRSSEPTLESVNNNFMTRWDHPEESSEEEVDALLELLDITPSSEENVPEVAKQVVRKLQGDLLRIHQQQQQILHSALAQLEQSRLDLLLAQQLANHIIVRLRRIQKGKAPLSSNKSDSKKRSRTVRSALPVTIDLDVSLDLTPVQDRKKIRESFGNSDLDPYMDSFTSDEEKETARALFDEPLIQQGQLDSQGSSSQGSSWNERLPPLSSLFSRPSVNGRNLFQDKDE